MSEFSVGQPFNPYRGVCGIDVRAIVNRQSEIPSHLKLVYMNLLGRAGKNGKCYPSQTTIGKDLGKSSRQIRYDLKKLEKLGLIRTVRHGKRLCNNYEFLWHAMFESERQFISDHGNGNREPKTTTDQRTTDGQRVSDHRDSGRQSVSDGDRKPAATGDRQSTSPELGSEKSESKNRKQHGDVPVQSETAAPESNGSFQWFCQTFYPPKPEPDTERAYARHIRSPEDRLALFSNLSIWLMVPKYANGYVDGPKFLNSGVWRKPPDFRMIPENIRAEIEAEQKRREHEKKCSGWQASLKSASILGRGVAYLDEATFCGCAIGQRLKEVEDRASIQKMADEAAIRRTGSITRDEYRSYSNHYGHERTDPACSRCRDWGVLEQSTGFQPCECKWGRTARKNGIIAVVNRCFGFGDAAVYLSEPEEPEPEEPLKVRLIAALSRMKLERIVEAVEAGEMTESRSLIRIRITASNVAAGLVEDIKAYGSSHPKSFIGSFHCIHPGDINFLVGEIVGDALDQIADWRDVRVETIEGC